MSNRRNKRLSESVTLDISGINHQGRGIANIQGKVAFVDGALPGEKITANYVRDRSQFSELITTEIISGSEERVKPPCEYNSVCGGCSLQHWDSNKQLDFKQAMLIEHLQHAVGLKTHNCKTLPQIKAKNTNYRRKARLAVRKVVKKGGVLVGFREKYSSFVTDMRDCKILAKEVAILISPLREFILTLDSSCEIPQIEIAVGEAGPLLHDGLEIALVIRHLSPLSLEDECAINKFADAHDLDVYLQSGGPDSVCKLNRKNKEERLNYYLPEFDLRLSFHPLDFTQVNSEINRLIVNRAVAMLELGSADVVLDLFCGLGNFTLPIAKYCAKAIGIEGSEVLVQRGEENAKFNVIENVEFYSADLRAVIESESWYQQSFTRILLDPPRSGAIEVIPQIAKLRALKIIYISCNPVTLARDAAELVRQGYRLNSAGVMDMFPHTTHVESIAEFILQAD